MHRSLLVFSLLVASAVASLAGPREEAPAGVGGHADPSAKAAACGRDAAVADDAANATPPSFILRRCSAHMLLDAGNISGATAEFGAIVEERPDDARAWFDYAVALADAWRFREAAAAIAQALALDPQNFETNKLAVIAFERAAREHEAYQANLRLSAMGDRIAMYDIAEALLYGRGVDSDPPHAVQWLERAAAGGHFGAMERLVRIYRDGLYERTPDPALADFWSRRAQEVE